MRGSKAWTTHGGHADHYTLFARTAPDRTGGISCFHVDGDPAGLSFGAPERKMGLTGSPTATVVFDDVVLDADRLVDAPGRGLPIALAALDSGRLSGTGLDVFEGEPPPADHPLRRHPRVICTPHVSGVTDRSLVNMGVMAAECIAAVLRGEPLPPGREVLP